MPIHKFNSHRFVDLSNRFWCWFIRQFSKSYWYIGMYHHFDMEQRINKEKNHKYIHRKMKSWKIVEQPQKCNTNWNSIWLQKATKPLVIANKEKAKLILSSWFWKVLEKPKQNVCNSYVFTQYVCINVCIFRLFCGCGGKNRYMWIGRCKQFRKQKNFFFHYSLNFRYNAHCIE